MANSPEKDENDLDSGNTLTSPVQSTPASLDLSRAFAHTPETIVEHPAEEEKYDKSASKKPAATRPGLPRSVMTSMTGGMAKLKHSRAPSTTTNRPALPTRGHQMSKQQTNQSQQQPLGWVEDDYFSQNPWYGKAAEKPTFSLGKPFPHKMRWRLRRPAPAQNDEELGGQRPPNEDALGHPVDITLDSNNNMRLSPQNSATERELQEQQCRRTTAGAAHSDRRNDAGQPVFDYIPEQGESKEPHSNNQAGRTMSSLQRATTSATSATKRPTGYDYKIDGEPIGQQEHPDVEEGLKDPDELRNRWARFRARHPEMLAEFLATGVGVFMGLAGTLSVNLSSKQSTVYGDYETSCWAWGFAWMFGIYLGGGVSGAHMNPAISISLSIFRGFPWRMCALYVVSQFVASIVAGALAYGIFADSIHHVDPELSEMSKAFFSTPQEWVSMKSAFGNQIVGGAIMMVAVFALGDDQNNPPGAGMHALVLGLLVTTLKFTLGYNIGSALNPASDFGPRVIAYAVGYRGPEIWETKWWLYGPWIATIIGSILGCVIYDGFIFVGSESPVNYRPSEEMKKRTKKMFQFNEK